MADAGGKTRRLGKEVKAGIGTGLPLLAAAKASSDRVLKFYSFQGPCFIGSSKAQIWFAAYLFTD
jgi:hypothetical protein